MDKDKLEDFIRKQVEQHQSPTDPDLLWQKIQAKQAAEKKPKRRFIFFWWLLGGFVLGALTFFGLFQFLDSKELPQQKSLDAIEQPVLDIKAIETESDKMEEPQTVIEKSVNTNLLNPSLNIKKSIAAAPMNQVKTDTKQDFKTTKKTDTHLTSTLSATTKNSGVYIPENSQRLTNNEVRISENKNPMPHKNNKNINENEVDTKDRLFDKNLVSTNVKTAISLPFLNTSIYFLNLEEKPSFAQDLADKVASIDLEKTDEERVSKWRTSIGTAFTYGAAFRSLTAKNTADMDYLNTRKETEKSLDATRSNLNIMLQHQNGLYLKSGLEYEQINERFSFYTETDSVTVNSEQVIAINFLMDGSSVETIGEGTTTTTYWHERTRYNRYRSVDIPLVVGYQSTAANSRWGWFVEGGAAINIWFNATGEITNADNIPVALEEVDLFKQQTGVRLIGAAGLTYQLTNQFSFWLSPDIKYHLNSMTNDQNRLDQKYTNLGLRIGMRYHFD